MSISFFSFYFILPTVLLLFSVSMFLTKRKHLLLVLLSLEFIILSVFLLLFIYLNLLVHEEYLSMYYLAFSVCESCLGLAVLVAIIRTHGNDHVQSFSVTKF